jgi:hypothetical protein
MKRSGLVISIIFILIACGSALAGDQDKPAKIKVIGVISLSGSDLCINYRKTIINSNPKPDFSTINAKPKSAGLSMRVFNKDIKGLAIANSALTELRNLLQYDGRYVYRDISGYNDLFGKLQPAGYETCWDSKDYDIYAIRNVLGEVKRKFGVDAIIFILDSMMATMNESPDKLYAHGLYRAVMPTGFFRSKHQTFAYSAIRLVVVDTATFDEIASSFGRTYRVVDDKYMNIFFDQWSVEDQRWFAESLRTLSRASVRKALRETGLIK